MRIYVILTLVLSLVLPGMAFAQLEEQEEITVELVKPIEVTKSKAGDSRFVDLTEKGIEMKVGDATLVGKAEYRQLPDKTTRTTIRWHTVKIQKGDKQYARTLQSALISQFRVDEPRVEVGEQFKAVGNKLKLTEDIAKLLAQAEKADSVKIQEDDESKAAKEAENSDLADKIGQSLGSSLSAYDTSGQSGVSTTVAEEDENTTEIEACEEVMIDYDTLEVFKQERTLSYTNGVLTSQSACAPVASSVMSLESEQGECGYVHDFEEGISTQLVQLFYMDGADKILVGECQESDITYVHIMTSETCDPIIDEANAVVIQQERVSIDLGGGTMLHASECRAVSTEEIPIQTEACDPMYRHDYVNGVSYLQTSTFWMDLEGERHNLNACSDTPTKTYTHYYEDEGCGGWLNEDEVLQATLMSYRYINEDDGSVLEIEACQARGQPVSYAYLGLEPEKTYFFANSTEPDTEWTVPDGVNTIEVAIVAGGARGGYFRGPDGEANLTGGGLLGGLGGSEFSYGSDFYGNPDYCSYATSQGLQRLFAGGGGGGNGEVIETSISVIPGNVFLVSVGQSEENSVFGDFIARWGQGSNSGQKGQSSLGTTWDDFQGRGATGWVDDDGFGTDLLNYQTYPVLIEDLWCAKNPQEEGVPSFGTSAFGFGAGGSGTIDRRYEYTGPSSCSIRLSQNGCEGWQPGQDGVVRVQWDVMHYLRPDGSDYYLIPEEE